jgi:hypothetical protein
MRLKFALAVAFIAGLALSPKLWLSERYFPHIPVLPGLPVLPAQLDAAAYALMLASLVLIAIRARPLIWIAIFAATICVLGLSDQMRWQPWAYQYLWMLGAVALGAQGNQPADQPSTFRTLSLNTARLVVACTYFWSGVQKLNSDFSSAIFPYLVKPLTPHLPSVLAHFLAATGPAVPVLEAAFGVGLLFPRVRKFAVAGAIGMHAFILASIGPWGHNYNSVVWPWNLAMVSFLLILFGPGSRSISAGLILWPASVLPPPHARSVAGWYAKAAVLAVGLLPALSLINRWDAYHSFALYSGFTNDGLVEMRTTFADRLPKPVLYHVFVSKKPGMTNMYLAEWSMDELNVPINPEPRIYKAIGRYFCAQEKTPGEVNISLYERHNWFGGHKLDFDCATLSRL